MKISQSTNAVEGLLALPFLLSIEKYYPDISSWYINKALPGVVTGSDVLLIAKHDNKIAGISLGKISTIENKLRCVRIHPNFQNTGLGIKLIDKTLEHIGDKPLCSVSEELLHNYSRIFVQRYGFSLSSVNKGMYRKHKLEYVFNE